MKICERCGCEHDGSYGSGRFCSSLCAHRTTSTKFEFYEYNINRIWKQIQFAPSYFVSNFGEISKYVYGRFVKINQRYSKKGYLVSTLCLPDGKKKLCQVHRLVMLTFNPIENSDIMQVNHRNEIKDDNRLDNLEWCTNDYNIHYGTALKRSYEHSHKKKVICVETEVIYKSLTEASKQNGIALSNLSNCCNGKIKTCKGYHWEFC